MKSIVFRGLGAILMLGCAAAATHLDADPATSSPAPASHVSLILNPQTAVRGAVIEVTLANPPANAKVVKVAVDGVLLDANMTSPGVFQATIPDLAEPQTSPLLSLGKHRVSLVVDGHWYTGDQTLIIDRSDQHAVLTGVSPSNLIVGSDTRSLTLTGTHFATQPPTDNEIAVDGVPLPVIWDKCDQPSKWKPDQLHVTHGEVDEGGTTITLCNVSMPDKPSAEITLRQGLHETAGFRVMLSPWSRLTIVSMAVLIVLLCVGLIMLLVWTARTYRIGDTDYGILPMLFLDLETDTYSLSKFQFYLWTGASIFAYAYFVISRMFVQGLAFPDVPSSLPGIIAIGAGTAIGSQVVTGVRGPKGGGPEKPSLSDFVTSGGVAAADRIQMLLWTIVGVTGFCIATIKIAPWSIKTLPQIGSGLMMLMGISSAGYLGGKLARKPGPVINEISISPSGPDAAPGDSQTPVPPGDPAIPLVRVIEIRGRNLSSDGTFEIDGAELPFRMLTPVDGTPGPDCIAPEDDASLVNMARALRLSIIPSTLGDSDRASYDAWFKTSGKSHRFTITNPDGQMSDISFTLPPGSQQAKG